jgi:hypothetical protein
MAGMRGAGWHGLPLHAEGAQSVDGLGTHVTAADCVEGVAGRGGAEPRGLRDYFEGGGPAGRRLRVTPVAQVLIEERAQPFGGGIHLFEERAAGIEQRQLLRGHVRERRAGFAGDGLAIGPAADAQQQQDDGGTHGRSVHCSILG